MTDSRVDMLVDSITALRSIVDTVDSLPGDWLSWFQVSNVVLTGVGKSFDVAQLGASLLRSVGLAAHAIHATELQHGGFGTFYPGSSATLVLLSHSGRTREVLDVVDYVRVLRTHGRVIRTVAITMIYQDNPLALRVQHCMGYSSLVDGSRHGTIPTVSTTAQLAWLNVIACAEADLLPREQLTLNHPSGNLATIYKRMSSE
jgi:D-arabinose 5-phosphate isomerase GutQ